MKKVTDLDLKGKKVIIRSDLNVPLEDGVITDDYRIKKAIKTIKYVIDEGAKVILLSHLGRVKKPEDKIKNDIKVVAVALGKELGKKIIFVNDTRGKEVENAIDTMNFGDIVMLQNTRYEDLPDKKESSNNEELGKYWSSLGDVFINDAYGTAHREHASNVGISSNLPSAAGFLLLEELAIMEKLTTNPDRPYTVVLGGAKVKDKIGVIKNLAEKADNILISGGISYTFLKAMGYSIGESLLDEENIDFAKEMMEKYSDKIIVPIDFRVTKGFGDNDDNRVVGRDGIADDEQGLDIGPESIKKIEEVIASSKTVIWNGAAGVFEFSNFEHGTKAIALAMAKNEAATTVIGGGDNAFVAKKFGIADKVTHISTGGGATLMLLEGKQLPAIEVLS